MDLIKKYAKWIAIFVIFIALVVGSYFGYNKYFPKGIIAGLVSDQVAAIQDQYQADLAEKDKEIFSVNLKLKKSQAQVTVLNTKIKTLEGKIKDVQKPVTSQETKDRFRALGYAPVR